MKNQTKEDEIYAVVLKVGENYHIAFSSMPDLHQRYKTKEAAWLAARRNLSTHAIDPSLVVDLTNAESSELSKYLR